jgi:ABC-type antimicrobial peptide transport system permease subunit
MKIQILRVLIRAILLSLIAGIVVTIAGLMLGWKISTQFSDGFFLAGGILCVIGFLNFYGMINQDSGAGRQYSPVNNLDKAEGYTLDGRHFTWL